METGSLVVCQKHARLISTNTRLVKVFEKVCCSLHNVFAYGWLVLVVGRGVVYL